MSAFVVSKHHIDALVSAAVDRPPRLGPFSWYVAGERCIVDEIAGEVSLRVCGSEPHQYNETVYTPDALGAHLLRENWLSVGYCYDETPDAPEYTFARHEATPVQVLKAIACYQYQTCEHPTHKQSSAWAFCDALRYEIVSRLAGYEDADWEISEPSPPASVSLFRMARGIA